MSKSWYSSINKVWIVIIPSLGCIKKPKISQITLLFWYVLWLWYLRTVPKNWTIPTKIEWPQPLFSFGPFKRVKRLKNGSKNLIFKNWLDTRPKMETHDPNVYPTILGGVSRGFWTPFLDRGARSAIFWHVKTGTFFSGHPRPPSCIKNSFPFLLHPHSPHPPLPLSPPHLHKCASFLP